MKGSWGWPWDNGEKMKRNRCFSVGIFLLVLIVIAFLGFFFFTPEMANAQSCPIVLEHKGARVTLVPRVTEVMIFFDNPRFFSPNKINCGDVKLFRKDENSPIVLSYRQYGPVLKFWPQKRLENEKDYILRIKIEEYPIHVSKKR